MNELLDISIRLVVALMLGGIIGIEREFRAKDAGFRTHFLVSVGSALFCVVSQYGFGEEMKDASRVAAQVVSGIGFLGAGMIILQKNYGCRSLGDSCHRPRLRFGHASCGTDCHYPRALRTRSAALLHPKHGLFDNVADFHFAQQGECDGGNRETEKRQHRAVFL